MCFFNIIFVTSCRYHYFEISKDGNIKKSVNPEIDIKELKKISGAIQIYMLPDEVCSENCYHSIVPYLQLIRKRNVKQIKQNNLIVRKSPINYLETYNVKKVDKSVDFSGFSSLFDFFSDNDTIFVFSFAYPRFLDKSDNYYYSKSQCCITRVVLYR